MRVSSGMSWKQLAVWKWSGRIIAGAIVGGGATYPMSKVMEALEGKGVAEKGKGGTVGGGDPLPPREITVRLARRVGLRLTEREKQTATYAGHYAYGAAAGGLYGMLFPIGTGVARGVAQGAAYGLGVWGVSYLGWLPLVGLMKPATRHRPRRVRLMILAHLVWGGVLGGCMGRVQSRHAPTARRITPPAKKVV